jgi:hypothetical protein
MVGDEAIVVVSGTPYELTTVMVGTGVVGTDGVTETLDGVETVTVAPCSVVMVTKSGVGRWRVAEPPWEVTTGTVDSQVGTLMVAVPPE